MLNSEDPKTDHSKTRNIPKPVETYLSPVFELSTFQKLDHFKTGLLLTIPKPDMSGFWIPTYLIS